MSPLNRRKFLSFAAAALPCDVLGNTPTPIIDTHIHLFDPTRPQGVPWPPKDDAMLYKPALPARFIRLTQALGVVGAIEIEASPWLEDNQWVLGIAAKNPIIVGTVGDLEPGQAGFRNQLERFSKNPMFRGIRYGNLWGRDLGARLAEPAFIADLKALADAGLEMDTANPDPALIDDVVRLTDKVPALRVVIDHLPRLQKPGDLMARRACEENLRKLGGRPQVYVKVSGVLQRVNGRVPLDLATYRPVLDQLWEIFGEDRLLYGSDWPNSDTWGTYVQELEVVRGYFVEKGRRAEEKFFWKNSLAAYRWVRRDNTQPAAIQPS
ncbi:MAG: amidohydrolase family protein [Acidobacteriota bacterium]|nr:amidohydrolase family protein [Acidobacteriota bacterium]